MWSRRRFLILGGSTAACIGATTDLGASAGRRLWTNDPFTLGVASGAPTTDGFVLWTRLAPDPLSPDSSAPGGLRGADIPLRYEVAEDPAMRRIVVAGTAIAQASYAYAVHQNVDGLSPGREYWYRFQSGGAVSEVGRALTLPMANANARALKLGFVSCSNFEQGYFSAYRHLANEQPDFVVYLGDYIYEYADLVSKDLVRRHSDGRDASDLKGYRNRYAQYHLDDDLRKLRASCTSLTIWDDHEVANDYGSLLSQDFSPPELFRQRRSAAYQAFYEHMPVTPTRSPKDGVLRIYDRFRYGNLAELHLTDARQYRSAAACYGPPDHKPGRMITDAECPERLSATRSMLGATQEQWLSDGLVQSSAHWNVIASSILMAQVRRRDPEGSAIYWTDDWNGYPAARSRLLRRLHDARVRNALLIGGDIHSYWANDLKLEFDDPNSPTVATEFVGTSISAHPPTFDFEASLPENPHVQFFDKSLRGYATLRLESDRGEVQFRAISDPHDWRATVGTLKTFHVDPRRPGVEEA